MDVKDILELAEKLSELPVREVKWGSLYIVFDGTSETHDAPEDTEDEDDDLEPAEELTDEQIKFWSSQ